MVVFLNKMRIIHESGLICRKKLCSYGCCLLNYRLTTVLLGIRDASFTNAPVQEATFKCNLAGTVALIQTGPERLQRFSSPSSRTCVISREKAIMDHVSSQQVEGRASRAHLDYKVAYLAA